jgi:sec-independent protein translocase protein TatA
MFDPSAPHIIILLVVVLLLFGSTRLPGAADSLGRAMHIFRKSVKGEDTQPADAHGASQATAAPPPAPQQLASPTTDVSQQAQIDALQRQLADIQRQTAGSEAGPGNGSAPAGQHDTKSY